jgi:hypothetical protein
MINYARERAIEILKTAHTAVLATVGLTGVKASEFPCESVGMVLYLLVPKTSDHLFNLEQDKRVALHSKQWEITGKALVLSENEKRFRLSRFSKIEKKWYVIVKIIPNQIQVLRQEGWGPYETIDLTLSY